MTHDRVNVASCTLLRPHLPYFSTVYLCTCSAPLMVVHVFEFDRATPHAGVDIDDTGVATRDTNGGWITLRASEPLSSLASSGGAPPPSTAPFLPQRFAIRILDQGEGNDTSGLMIGVLPKIVTPAASAMMASKYIAELGGWCLSRAGESYGTWKCDRLAFGTGQVVEFEVDFVTRAVTVSCGKDIVTGQLPATLPEGDDLYPAVSLYYINQKVVFV